jgi:hypothetical protein
VTDTYETKDSGSRQPYSSGMVRDADSDKPRFDLISPLGVPFEEQMLTRWAWLMSRGAGKYGVRNWERAKTWIEYRRFKGSAWRHFMQWYFSEDDTEDHAAAVMFNITAAEYVNYRKLIEADRREQAKHDHADWDQS